MKHYFKILMACFHAFRFKLFFVACLLLFICFNVTAQNVYYRTITLPSSGNNSGIGWGVLNVNSIGFYNAACGDRALYNNTKGNCNSSTGARSMYNNKYGNRNTANGTETLYLNINGVDNTAIGFRALFSCVGSHNTSIGNNALFANSNGYSNVAAGDHALASNTFGHQNVALGSNALHANVGGSCNTGVGFMADVLTSNLTNATAVGYKAVVNANNKIRLGDLFTTIVETQFCSWSSVSDARFKINITEDIKGLEFIQKLRPVIYNFDTRKFQEFLTKNMPDSIRNQYMDKDFGPSTAIRQSGFIAQEVEKAAKEVGYDFNGVHVPENDDDNYSLAYAEFTVPIVKAIQEQQEIIEKQQLQIDELKKLVSAFQTPNQSGSLADDAFKVFPNPNTGIFTVRIKGLTTGSLQIRNLEGINIYQTDLIPNAVEYKINLLGQAQGTYILTLTSDFGEIASQKIVIE